MWSNMLNKFSKVKLLAVIGLAICAILVFILFRQEEVIIVDDKSGGEVAGEEVKLTLPDNPIDEKTLPVSLDIPALKLSIPFGKPLGLTAQGEVEVPVGYDEVGWYKYGPTPGKLGPAVILGHVDSKVGPAVFYSLGQLKPGDDISVKQADGTIFHFVIEEIERVKQDAFPTDRVYGDVDYVGLRLITCSGTYLRGEKRYSHNLIVYARQVEG